MQLLSAVNLAGRVANELIGTDMLQRDALVALGLDPALVNDEDLNSAIDQRCFYCIDCDTWHDVGDLAAHEWKTRCVSCDTAEECRGDE
jgi:hypothetical protein